MHLVTIMLLFGVVLLFCLTAKIINFIFFSEITLSEPLFVTLASRDGNAAGSEELRLLAGASFIIELGVAEHG